VLGRHHAGGIAMAEFNGHLPAKDESRQRSFLTQTWSCAHPVFRNVRNLRHVLKRTSPAREHSQKQSLRRFLDCDLLQAFAALTAASKNLPCWRPAMNSAKLGLGLLASRDEAVTRSGSTP
jgi:hypothetical protein